MSDNSTQLDNLFGVVVFLVLVYSLIYTSSLTIIIIINLNKAIIHFWKNVLNNWH